MGSNEREKASRSEVVRVDERYLPELTEFYRTVWTPEATVDGVRDARARLAARNLAAPGEEIPTFLFLLDGRAIGHLSTIPFRLAAGGSEWPVEQPGRRVVPGEDLSAAEGNGARELF